MKLEILEANENVMRFVLSGVTPAFANALRRTMLNGIPTLAIEKVIFHQNTSSLYDEILAHRLGLIPIRFEPGRFNLKGECKCKGKGCSNCEARFYFDSKEARKERGLKQDAPLKVYSGDLKSLTEGAEILAKEIPIVELYEGQQLKFEAIAILGYGSEHAKWQASNTSFRPVPTIKISPTKCDGCGACVMACPRGVLEQKGKGVRVVNLENCNLCRACIDVCQKGAIELMPSSTDFLFTIETTSGLTPREILKLAIEELDRRAEEVRKELKLK